MKIKLFNHIIETSFDIYKIKNDDFFNKIADLILFEHKKLQVVKEIKWKYEISLKKAKEIMDKIYVYDSYEINRFKILIKKRKEIIKVLQKELANYKESA